MNRTNLAFALAAAGGIAVGLRQVLGFARAAGKRIAGASAPAPI